MAVSTRSNMVNPQVMGDMINAKINALAKMLPYAKVDTTLVGVPGDTKTVPSWNYIGEAEDYNVEGGSGIAEVALTASSTTFTIKCAAKGVSLYQTALNAGMGNPIGQAESQLAKSLYGKMDSDVVMTAYQSANIYDGTAGVINYSRTVDAVTKFEDEEDGIEKVMFIHPKQEAQILKDSDFLSADKFQAGVAVNGSIGKIAGCWIKKSAKVRLVTYVKDNDTGTVTLDADNLAEYQAKVDPSVTLAVGNKVKALSTAYYACPILKLEADSPETEYTEDELPAITIFMKKDTQVDAEWKPKYQRHDIYGSRYYGVAMTNAAKVVVAHFASVATA